MKTIGQFVIRTENFVDSKICGICEKTVYKHASISLIESDDKFHWKMHQKTAVTFHRTQCICNWNKLILSIDYTLITW